MRQPKPTLASIAALEADIAERDKRIADLEATVRVLLGAIRGLENELDSRSDDFREAALAAQQRAASQQPAERM